MDFCKSCQLFSLLVVILLSLNVESRPTRKVFRIDRGLVEKNGTTIHEDELKDYRTKVYRDNEEMCKIQANQNDVACRSRCKWGYKISFDVKRIPRVMVVASVSSDNCEPGYECAPLVRDVFVLRQLGECNSDMEICEYQPSFEPLSVGAGCKKQNEDALNGPE